MKIILLFDSLPFNQHLNTHPDASDPFQWINSYLSCNNWMSKLQLSNFISIHVTSHLLTRVPTNEWRVVLVSVLNLVMSHVSALRPL